MATNVYEGLFLLDSNRYARDPKNVSGQINEIVEQCGGEVLVSRLWNEQKLAYQINGHRKGTYWLTYFRLDSLKQPELNRACQLNDAILRNLVLRVDDRLIDALVSHATTSPEEAVETQEGDDGGEKASDSEGGAGESTEPKKTESETQTADSES